MSRLLRALSLSILALCFVRSAAAQANVNESLELYSFWVDVNTGSDSNPGTQSKPFKTISYAASQAVANNQAGKGTHVWINDGTYRESITISGSNDDTTYPITLEATHHGKAIVSGGVLYTGWTQYSANHSIYTNAWNNNWGLCATVPGCDTSSYPQPDIMLRQEVVAVNGTVLTQVLSVAQMTTATFFVDITKNVIYVWPPSGTNMSTATVDVATQPTLLTLSGKSNIVIRGLVFQYANSCRSDPAVSVGGSYNFAPTNILLDSNTFQWNNGQALAVSNPVTYFTVMNSSAIHNGDSGFQAYETQFGLWQNDLAAYNNWRGAQGAYYACNVAGFHPWAVHNDTLSSFTTQYNQAYGIHWDDDNVSVSGTGLIASENLLPGLFVEKNPGPISFDKSYVCNHTSPISFGGLAVRNSEGVSFTNGVIYNNAVSQIAVTGQPGGIEVDDWLNGKTYNLITQGMVTTGNVIEGLDSSQMLFSNPSLDDLDWTTFLIGFNSNKNTWWNPENSDEPFIVPEPAIGTSVSLSGWQSTTLQDLNSKFALPTGSPQTKCMVSADVNDYWLIANSNTETLDASGQTTFDFTIMPLLNFSGTVKFTLDGISEVAGLSSSGLTSVNTSGDSTLTINSTTSTKAGTYPITVIGNSGNLTRTVTVNLVVPAMNIRLSTGKITFPDTQQGTTSAAQNFTVQNTGTKSLSITSITASNNFAISSNNCGSSLAAGRSCTVSVTFTPAFVATISGTVTLTDGDKSSPQTVSLTGTGTAPPIVSLSPRNLSFGPVGVGSSSAQPITLTNTGLSTLKLTGSSAVAITGNDASDYSQTNTCGAQVLAGASCTITVTFKPHDAGSSGASVTITDNANNSPQNVSLAGSGALPTATLSPSSDNFGSVTVGTTSTGQVSTLTNTSSYLLSVTSITITGTNAGDFSQTNTCPVGKTLGANKTCTITVKFTAGAKGTRTATLTESDNSAKGSHTITLSGSGK